MNDKSEIKRYQVVSVVYCWSFLLLREVFLPGSPVYPPPLPPSSYSTSILHNAPYLPPKKIRMSSVFNFS